MQCVDLGGRRIIKKNFFKQKTAYEISECLVGSEMCIRDRYSYLQVEIATYLLNKRGGEGELSHSENGISRSVSYTHLTLPTICSV